MNKKAIKLYALLVCIVLVIALGVVAIFDRGSGEVQIVNSEEVPLKLWYDEEASIMKNENSPTAVPNGSGEDVVNGGGEDVSWEEWSLPIGNSYFGANVFGRTETERIQISEKTLRNPWSVSQYGETYNVGGMNNFSETYIDFNHTNSAVTDYRRELDLETAISSVEYTYNGVKFTREYFVSYPDKVIVIRLNADTDGKLDFVLRPTIPFEQSYAAFERDGITKEGTVTSKVENGVGHIELAGKMGHYDIDFLGLYRVYTDGGIVQATTTEHTYKDSDGTSKTDTDGTITVQGANSAYIVVTLGSDYELSSEMLSAGDRSKPTKNTTLDDTRKKVGGYMSVIEKKISDKSYENAYKALKDTHIQDHNELFGRVALDLDFDSSEYDITTDKLVKNYRNGAKSAYLETLIFQYGRYLLIASSRENALPATLQGVWNTYNVPPWASDYTHNINVQMNYWPAFSTNLAETFDAYVDYNAAYMEKAESFADENIGQYNPLVYGEDGGNGWVIGAHIDQYKMTSGRSAGELGFTTQLFWEYYSYTKDPAVLENVYEILVGAARYITKCVEQDEDGNYLVSYCDSPEMYVNGVWYYTTGTTYAQTFAYMNNYNALCAAKEMGIDLEDTELLSQEEYSILNTIMEQIEKYDPIHVGLSGQIKEFRDETYYGSIGDEYNHRHISQLMGLYPANIINSTTTAWLDAAKVSLDERGDSGSAWGVAHKMNLWARTKDGNRSYKLYQTLIKEDMAYNLWSDSPLFQIDGNFGATAGVSEMLLQSHEGYIHPLAAIPDTWSTGSYTGLVARGNFEVSAAWENGLATAFNIKSKSGGEASVYCPSTKGVYVVTDDGTRVDYTKNGNVITFDTTKGETYVIAGFTAQKEQAAPTNFGYTKTETGAYELSWKTPAGAVSYNVYVAVENDAAYTLIDNTTATTLTYTPDDENARMTFVVSAVNLSGVESERVLCYNTEPVETKYGTIPGEHVGYPFVLFIKGSEKNAEYAFVGSYTSFYNAANEAKDLMHAKTGQYKGGTAVVYMTRNCKATRDSFNNASEVDGTLILDLGGYEMTMGANRLIGFDAKDVEGALDHTTRVEVKNGTILTLTNPIAEVWSENEHEYTGTKKFELLFKDVTFGKAAVAEDGVTLLTSRGEFSSKKKAEIKVEFKNCTFDYASQKSAVTIIDCSQGGEFAKCTVKINGGKVKAPNLDTVTVFKGSKNDTLNYTGKDISKITLFKLSDVMNDIILNATVVTEDNTVNHAFAATVLKYANKVFESGNDVEKQLIRDVLSYIRAAYEYFDSDDIDAVAAIDELIGVNYEWLSSFTSGETTVNPESNNTPVVERFLAYSQSVQDYINSVEVQIKYVDENGKELAETYKNRYKSGEEFSVLSPGVEGYYTREIYKIASATNDTVFEVVYKKIPTNVDESTIKEKFPDIVSWGDSITAGAFAHTTTVAKQYGIDLVSLGSTKKGGTYPEVLQNLIASRVYSGIDVANCGVGGESTATIAARANTENYYLYLGKGITVGSKPVVIDLQQKYPDGVNPGRLGVLRKDFKDSLSCVTIVDSNGTKISGKLTCKTTDDFVETDDYGIWNCETEYLVYTFERTDGKTNKVKLGANSKVIMDAAVDFDGRTCIVFMGENNGYSNAGTTDRDVKNLIAQQKEILKACGNPENFLILSSTSGTNASRLEITEALTEEWGDRYINIGNELNSSRKSYDFAGFSETVIVSIQQKIINGSVSSLLLNDECHPHAVGYAVVGNVIFERMFKLNMFEALFDYYDSLQK